MDARDSIDARGEATRRALVDAAIELFGERGYHAASNRALAAAAGVNQALIGYHFGGKRGLYLAAFEAIADELETRIGPGVAAVAAELESPAGEAGEEGARRRRLRELLFGLVDALVATFGGEASAPWARLVVAEQQRPSEAFDLLWERVMSRVLSALCGLVAGITGGRPEAAETRLVALTIAGQALVFRVARAAVLRGMEWEEMGQAEVAAAQRRVRANVEAILTAAEGRGVPGAVTGGGS